MAGSVPLGRATVTHISDKMPKCGKIPLKRGDLDSDFPLFLGFDFPKGRGLREIKPIEATHRTLVYTR